MKAGKQLFVSELHPFLTLNYRTEWEIVEGLVPLGKEPGSGTNCIGHKRCHVLIIYKSTVHLEFSLPYLQTILPFFFHFHYLLQ